jgi:hypothetical protein
LTKQGALNFGAAQLAQDVELVGVLDALGGHCHTKVARGAGHGQGLELIFPARQRKPIGLR